MNKYNCETCNYSCNWLSYWKIHLKSKKHNNNGKELHITSKRFNGKCEFCDFETNDRRFFKQHMLNKHSKTIEEKKKGYKYYCENCDFGSFQDILWKKHCETKKHLHFIALK